MRNLTMINKLVASLALVGAALMVSHAAHADTSSELESLGNNEKIVRRANQLDSRSRVGIVQGRTVPRNWRLEAGVNYGPVAAGDSYLLTQNLGGQLDLHINPKFSLGVRYSKAFNQLTQEGKQRFENARVAQANGETFRVPKIDYPEQTVMGMINWYMLYGKINLFDWSVVQFDIYSLAGYGQVKLSSGNTNTWTAGGGIGFWLTKHVSSRFELRYQNYADQGNDSSRNLNLIVANAGLGVLL